MKKMAMILSLALAGGAAATQARAAINDEKGYGAKAQSMDAEVLSTDATAKTLTVKTATEASKTLAVDAKAVTSLKSVKAGDKVTLKLSNDSVVEIKTRTPTMPSEQP